MLHLQVKCELQAQRYVSICYIYALITLFFSPRNLVTQLQDVINTLSSSRHPQILSKPDMAPNQENSDGLVVPDSPPPLDQANYPDACHWHLEHWMKYSEQQLNLRQLPPRLAFLTDEDGNPATESWMKMFMSTAKQAWNELYRLQLEPSSWTKKTHKAASYFAYIMKTNFNEFRYCDGNWKVEWFATIKYPDWCHDARVLGCLTCTSGILFSHSLYITLLLGARPSKCKIGDGNPIKDKH